MASTKLGGDEVGGTASDARGDSRTETTTVGGTETDVNKVEVVTDVNKVAVVADVDKGDEVTDADPETRGPTRRAPADTYGDDHDLVFEKHARARQSNYVAKVLGQDRGRGCSSRHPLRRNR